MLDYQERERQFDELIWLSQGRGRFGVYDGYWEYRWLGGGGKKDMQGDGYRTDIEPVRLG